MNKNVSDKYKLTSQAPRTIGQAQLVNTLKSKMRKGGGKFEWAKNERNEAIFSDDIRAFIHEDPSHLI